ncbi:hypothetical protein E4K67_20385 [Desulfosporosinus fructosivorans]|uniref:DUF2768 domain-containing protein n=1 Tax=Desulfosporosinus fructosivorans TaxID=2018669 RepID=A0A4Z0R2T3_9FIRM|nr:hypothetical protein [Desulfosporosinus fructosivorans]TGE36297.1 hypothetical protein E4K67_20385 [Desulfosporosinus fructosivorans]
MSKFEFLTYLIFSWLPIITIVTGAILMIAGAVLKHKGLAYKKLFTAGIIFLAIFLLCLVALGVMGLIGVDPGRFD